MFTVCVLAFILTEHIFLLEKKRNTSYWASFCVTCIETCSTVRFEKCYYGHWLVTGDIKSP